MMATPFNIAYTDKSKWLYLTLNKNHFTYGELEHLIGTLEGFMRDMKDIVMLDPYDDGQYDNDPNPYHGDYSEE